MDIGDITSDNCDEKMMETTISTDLPCQLCTAISTGTCETVPKGLSCSCSKEFQGNSSPIPTSSMLDQKASHRMTENPGHQQKRAVLCGVSYSRRAHKLEGPINDVNLIKSHLVKHFSFPEDAIFVLTEEQNNPNHTPTKENIKRALNWLVDGCMPGDSLVFYFSGHGLQQTDSSKDEPDALDETICPTDFMTAGMIIDDYINETIVRPLKKGVTLHAIIDACHSGSILDLDYVYDRKEKQWKENRPPSGVSKGTEGGLAISFSACADNQMAADTTAFSDEMIGAMTYTLVQASQSIPGITYAELLSEMNEMNEDAHSKGCLNAPFLKKLFHRKLIQEFQLSSSECLDVDAKVFKL